MKEEKLYKKVIELTGIPSEKNFDELIKVLEDSNINFKNNPILVLLTRYYGFHTVLVQEVPNAEHILENIEYKLNNIMK